MPTIITISGFGDPDVNGFYELDGKHDGQDFYKKDTGDHIITYRTQNGAYSNDPAYWIEEVVSENGAVPIFVPKYSASEDDIDSAEWKATSNVDDDTVGVLGLPTFMYLPCTTCGCEGKTTPRISVTISWDILPDGSVGEGQTFPAEIESYELFGCTFFNGQTKEVCASSYNASTNYPHSFEVWEKMPEIELSNNHVGNKFQRKRGLRKVSGKDIVGDTGFLQVGIVDQLPPYKYYLTPTTAFADSGTMVFSNLNIVLAPLLIKPVDLFGSIVGTHFGSLTTTGGLTIKWSRLSPADSVESGIDYWVATSP